MQQRFRRLAFFIGAASLAGGSVIVVACGTDNGDNVQTPQLDGAKPDSAGSEGGPGVDGGGEGGADAGADCGKNPILRDFTNSFRCAFADAGGRDSGSNCTNTETCCNTSEKFGSGASDFYPSFCANGAPAGDDPTVCKAQAAANGSSFDGGSGSKAWECSDKNACTAGQVCCVIQDPRTAGDATKKLNMGDTPKSDDKHPQACGVQRVYNEGGSRCRTAVGGNCPMTAGVQEIKLCSLSDMNCGAGTTCTPFVDFQETHRGFCK